MCTKGRINIPIFETSLKLDPTRHKDSVHLFRDFFKLPQGRPELKFLREIIAHFSRLPYENISKIIKLNRYFGSNHKLRLPEEVMDDHSNFRLGGTCFSLTFFLQTILTHNGFYCYPVMADMRAGRNIHCALIVQLKGVKYLVDPGYLLSQPMEINPRIPRLYRTEFTGVELRYDSKVGCYNLFTFNRHEVKWRYRFYDRPTKAEEFLQHWQASFSKNTMHGICLTKVTPQGLIYVHKTFMRETTFEGKRNFNIKKNYHATIHEVFGIEPQLIEQAEVALVENLQRERKYNTEDKPA